MEWQNRWSCQPGWCRILISLACALIVLELADRRGTAWFHWTATTRYNPALLEGYAWHFGHLWLPHRLWDTAFVARSGRVYNVFPPLLSIIGSLATGGARVAEGKVTYPVFHTMPLLLFGLPLPIVGYIVFLRRTGSEWWAAVLLLGWLGGTAVLPCIEQARNDGVHHINHLLSQIGLLVMADQLLQPAGRRRFGIALLGLMIAAWSRQLTILYAIAMIAEAWREKSGSLPAPAHSVCRSRRLALLGAGLALIMAVPAGLNQAKFGSPLNSGYDLIYVGRDTDIARDARAHGLFSTAFVARNAYEMNLALPWSWRDGALRWNPSPNGASIWLTTPLLVLVLLGLPAWWREPPARNLFLCSLPIIAALLLYHNTGYRQPGYYRFALDFIPVWLLVGGRSLIQGWRRWATLGAVAWSVAYFAMVLRWPAVSGS